MTEQEANNIREDILKASRNGVLDSVTKRTYKCLGCQHYDIRVADDKGGILKVCEVREDDPRAIVDLDAPNCTNYEYGW